jgi:hypothetical protein
MVCVGNPVSENNPYRQFMRIDITPLVSSPETYTLQRLLKVLIASGEGLHLITHAIGSPTRAKASYWGEVSISMQHYDSRPSYLLVGLIEESEFRELLDEIFLYAL